MDDKYLNICPWLAELSVGSQLYYFLVCPHFAFPPVLHLYPDGYEYSHFTYLPKKFLFAICWTHLQRDIYWEGGKTKTLSE